MRIEKSQKIVGNPALQIRRIMREAARRHLTSQRVREILGCCDSSARKVVRDLVDVACELAPRFDDERQLLLEQARRAARDQGFRNLSHWASWPRTEVFQFLNSRARGLSIHELDAWVLGLAN